MADHTEELDPDDLRLVRSGRHLLVALAEELPSYLEAADELAMSVRFFVRTQRRESGARAVAQSRLVNHASNDLSELLQGSLYGTGRSMLRTARSLFESAVTAREFGQLTGADVLDHAERYVAHGDLASALPYGLTRMHRFRSRGRGYAQREKRAWRAAGQAETNGSNRWGSQWRTNWAGRKLRDRADDVNLLEDYDTFYRAASLPTHATSGGVIGTQRVIDGESVIRYGPALEACPLALVYGLAYFEMVLAEFGRQPFCDPLYKAIDDFKRHIRLYAELVAAVDEAIWPEEGYIPSLVPVVRVFPGLTAKWYVHDPVQNLVVEAHAPARDAMSEYQWNMLEEQQQMMSRLLPAQVSEAVTIAMLRVEIEPVEGAEWVHETLRLHIRNFFDRGPEE